MSLAERAASRMHRVHGTLYQAGRAPQLMCMYTHQQAKNVCLYSLKVVMIIMYSNQYCGGHVANTYLWARHIIIF